MKNYFIVINEKTGKPILHAGTLPIFWYKRLANKLAVNFTGAIVKPINIKDLEKLIKNEK